MYAEEFPLAPMALVDVPESFLPRTLSGRH
jgi:hypothetical protein